MSRGRKLIVSAEGTRRSIEVLREYFPVGSTAHTVLCSVSQSGMSRHLKVIGITYGQFTEDAGQRPRPINLSWHVARVLDYPLTDDHELVIGGAGMDMGFAVIYALSRYLYQYELGPVGSRASAEAGYAINQAWL